HVLLDIRAASKPDIIGIAARFLSSICKLPNPDIVVQKMLEREAQISTGIGYGIAIPHCHIEGINRSCMVAARLAEPIDFESLDDRPVQLVFMTASPTNTSADYTTILKTLCQILADETTREKLLGVETAGEFLDVIAHAEDALT
ncbi:MAG: transcriptional regulator, partial [Chitinivibrionales bacterium]|nr:transcriptional regulator [Chitinivibrionales bacterium]